MFEVVRFENGKTIYIDAYRDVDAAIAMALELSRTHGAVHAVRRRDWDKIIVWCVRGEKTTNAARVHELITDPDLPSVLSYEADEEQQSDRLRWGEEKPGRVWTIAAHWANELSITLAKI